MEEEGERGPEEGHLLIKIYVPELKVQKCLQFPRDQLVWDVKQQCLAALPKVCYSYNSRSSQIYLLNFFFHSKQIDTENKCLYSLARQV